MDENIQQRFKLFLRQITPVTDEELARTLPFFREQHLNKGAYFVRENQLCQHLAYIDTGLFRTFYVNEKGNEVTYCFCTENGFSTSFRSFVLQQPSRLSIQALLPTTLLMIKHSDLQGLYQTTPVWQTIGRLVTEKEFLVMEEYVSILNQDTAKEKYAWLLREQPQVIRQASVKYIASFLGVSRETLSRIRKQVVV